MDRMKDHLGLKKLAAYEAGSGNDLSGRCPSSTARNNSVVNATQEGQHKKMFKKYGEGTTLKDRGERMETRVCYEWICLIQERLRGPSR